MKVKKKCKYTSLNLIIFLIATKNASDNKEKEQAARNSTPSLVNIKYLRWMS